MSDKPPRLRWTLHALARFLDGLPEHFPEIGEEPLFWETVRDLRVRVEAARAEDDELTTALLIEMERCEATLVRVRVALGGTAEHETLIEDVERRQHEVRDLIQRVYERAEGQEWPSYRLDPSD